MPRHLVQLWVDDARYALPLDRVERVVRAVEVTPLPNAPPVVLGVIDVHGRVIPVLSLRRRAGLPDRAIDPSDQIVLARAGERVIGLLVDAAEVEPCGAGRWTTADDVLPGSRQVRGLVTRADGMVLVYDPARLLEPGEAEALDADEGLTPPS